MAPRVVALAQDEDRARDPAPRTPDRVGRSGDREHLVGSEHFEHRGVAHQGQGGISHGRESSVTGVKTFIVNHDGIVYEKDLGPETKQAVKEMWRYDPDPSWHPVAD